MHNIYMKTYVPCFPLTESFHNPQNRASKTRSHTLDSDMSYGRNLFDLLVKLSVKHQVDIPSSFSIRARHLGQGLEFLALKDSDALSSCRRCEENL